MKMTPWIDRNFVPILDNGLLPMIIERLDGTEYRLVGKLTEFDDSFIKNKKKGKWSIKEEVGHLFTLEPLWLRRVKEIQAGKEVLKEADMSNKATNKANFNAKEIEEILDDFGERREALLFHLSKLTVEDLTKSSRHPRLNVPMRIIDLLYFIAEHDDHHLARISKMLEEEN